MIASKQILMHSSGRYRSLGKGGGLTHLLVGEEVTVGEGDLTKICNFFILLIT